MGWEWERAVLSSLDLDQRRGVRHRVAALVHPRLDRLQLVAHLVRVRVRARARVRARVRVRGGRRLVLGFGFGFGFGLERVAHRGQLVGERVDLLRVLRVLLLLGLHLLLLSSGL